MARSVTFSVKVRWPLRDSMDGIQRSEMEWNGNENETVCVNVQSVNDVNTARSRLHSY